MANECAGGDECLECGPSPATTAKRAVTVMDAT